MNLPPAFAEASWICSEVVGGRQAVPPAPHFRKSFLVGGGITEATLHITALGIYCCEINGERVGDHELAPGWTDYRKRCSYQTYDVTSSIRDGFNFLEIVLGEGWFSGHVGWWGRQNYGERPQFIATLSVRTRDGVESIIASDTSWLTKTGPILGNDLIMGETYDARLELSDWREGREPEANWLPSILAPAPNIVIEKTTAPPVKRMEVFLPRSVVELPERTYPAMVFDFGQNMPGRARISLKASRGTTVTIRYGEVINPDGTVYFENLRAARATDHYTCKGEGLETWEPRFTYHGFRYVEITGITPGHPIKVEAVVLHSATERTGHFSCSSPLLNQLYSNIIWSQKGNFIEVPTDCPQRDERLGWTGDAQVFMRTACFNMDVHGFFQKWLKDMRDAQRKSGAIPCVIPKATSRQYIAFEDGGSGYSDAAIICPWICYLTYNDVNILDDCYEMMQRYMDFLARERCQGKIRSHAEMDSWGGYGDWLALDGSGRMDGGTPKDLIGTAFYANNAWLMSRVSTILGRESEARSYRQLHTEIVQAFRRRFVTAEGLITAGTQTAYVLALSFNLIPEELCPNAAQELVRDVERRGFHIATGFIGTPYILDVLEQHGYLDVGYKLLEQETFPSWLFPVKNGATTIWERWDGWTVEKGFQEKGMNSFNHYAYGAVGAWMVRSVAGLSLDEDSPGYEHVIFRPRPGGKISQAEASLETKHGLVGLKWELVGEELHVKLTIPTAVTATFDPPVGYYIERTDFSGGTHELIAKPVFDSAADELVVADS